LGIPVLQHAYSAHIGLLNWLVDPMLLDLPLCCTRPPGGLEGNQQDEVQRPVDPVDFPAIAGGAVEDSSPTPKFSVGRIRVHQQVQAGL